jgi:formylglycine-generating enzyme required for sulfatase activity
LEAPPAAVAPWEISTLSGVAMVAIPGGRFMRGSSRGQADEAPRRPVRVSPFAMDKFEVLQREFAALEIPDPSQFKSPDRPVEQVRWTDAALFCNERSRREGLAPCYDEATFACDFAASGYRLPTEAEWECAARAGVEGDVDYHFGSWPEQLRSYACYEANAKNKTDPAGRKRANPWGLHDLYGNVAEWCHDVYDPKYYPLAPDTDPRGPAEGDQRVLRGGSWKSSSAACRSAARQGAKTGLTDACFSGNHLGFRCVRRLTPDELQRLQPAQ